VELLPCGSAIGNSVRNFQFWAVGFGRCFLSLYSHRTKLSSTSITIFQHIYPPEYENHFDSLMLSAKEIRSRIVQLAELLHEDYVGKRPVLICTLKGACPFFQHLSDALQDLRQGYDLEFVRVSSYDGTSSTGNVKIMGELQLDTLKGRHVVVMEDIIDTGTTLASIMPIFEKEAQPASLQVCSLLDKRLSEPTKKLFVAKYVGFSIPDHFIIGYGLDFNELYRDLKDIFVISKVGIAFDPTKLHV
jgi:hypoxanthine phosphoribosyltransferase